MTRRHKKSRTDMVFFLNLLLHLGRGHRVVIGELQRLQLGILVALGNGEASHLLLVLRRVEIGSVLTIQNGVSTYEQGIRPEMPEMPSKWSRPPKTGRPKQDVNTTTHDTP